MSNATGKGSKYAALRSLTYLAFGDEGRNGLDSSTVEWSHDCIRAYKKNYVSFMVDKLGADKKDVSKKFDEFVLNYYKNELRAFEEPTQGQFWEREPGGYEYGDYGAFHASRKDEVSNDGYGWQYINAKIRTPEVRKRNNFNYLLNLVLYGNRKSNKRINRLLLNARGMHRNGAIEKSHMNRLIEAAAAVRKQF